jgi:hypothetical protein
MLAKAVLMTPGQGENNINNRRVPRVTTLLKIKVQVVNKYVSLERFHRGTILGSLKIH